MSKDVWRTIHEAALAGNCVQITLSPGHAVNRSKSLSGRPRVRGPALFGHYAGYDVNRGGRPKCKLKGCSNYLRRNQAVACCPAHKARLLAQAKAVLALADAEDKAEIGNDL